MQIDNGGGTYYYMYTKITSIYVTVSSTVYKLAVVISVASVMINFPTLKMAASLT